MLAFASTIKQKGFITIKQKHFITIKQKSCITIKQKRIITIQQKGSRRCSQCDVSSSSSNKSRHLLQHS